MNESKTSIKYEKYKVAYENPIIFPDEIKASNLKIVKVKNPDNQVANTIELGKSTSSLSRKGHIDRCVSECVQNSKNAT